jgi:4-diphosphocytidyl-2-C-methyl-D-erythritol kinase
MRETAYAKVNLALHVRAREADGYHRLETVFAFAEDGDDLEVAEPHVPGALELELSGPFAAALEGEPNNLVLRAAAALRELYGVSGGARLRLDKRLPVAAGIGGGFGGRSRGAAPARALVGLAARARAAARHRARARRGRARLHRQRSGAWRRQGRRADADHRRGPHRPPAAAGEPARPGADRPVFRAWDGVDRGPLGPELLGRNDLEAPARMIAPQVGEVLAALEGAAFAGMSGSGATCLGLYDRAEDCDSAAARVAAARPDWWLLVTGLR